MELGGNTHLKKEAVSIDRNQQSSRTFCLANFFRARIDKLIAITDGVIVSKVGKYVPAIIFAGTVGMNYYLWNTEKDSIKQNLEYQLDNQLSSIIYPIQGRIRSYEQMLFGMRGYFESNNGVSRVEFKKYISTLDLKKNFPEITGISYSYQEEYPRSLAYVHGTSPNSHQEHAPIAYIEPENEKNNTIIGYDNFTDFARKGAMKESSLKNEPVLSNPVILKQENKISYTSIEQGYIMFYPIDNPVIEKKGPKHGWGAIAFRVIDLVKHASFGDHIKMNIQIYDGDRILQEKILYDSRNEGNMLGNFDVMRIQTVDIGNRKWTFVIHSTEESESKMSHKGYLNNILKSGAFITFLLTIFSYIFIRTRREALETICNLKGATNTILQMANHDALTGLPNGSYFIEWTERAIAHADRNKTSLGIMFIDLDNFKIVNDSLGHHMGDELLKQVTKRMKDCLRSEDFVARKGGDEFMIALSDLRTGEDAANVAEKIIHTLGKPFQIQGKEIHIGSSIGIAVYPEDAKNVEDLQKRADIAMYGIKELGKNGFQFFSDGMQRNVEEQQILETALHNAIKNQELDLYYQPIIDVETGDIVSMEALLRWNQKDLGNIPPTKFIPIAESNGFIKELGLWTLEVLCKQINEWKKSDIIVPRMAYNLSLGQLRSRDIHTSFYEVLKKYDIKPREIEIEITESMLMDDIQNALVALRNFSHMGFRIAIDDFGTGYSSLNYLRKLKISTLKVDKTFIDDIVESEESFRVVAGIIALAHSIGMKIVAEGVETEEQYILLKKVKCDYIQGYYFGRPENSEETLSRLKQRNLLNTITFFDTQKE